MFAHATIVALVQRYRILSACDAFPYTIKFECAAGECAAYLQSVSTLYVGLARAVSPTNTNFRLTFLLTRLQEALYEDLAV